MSIELIEEEIRKLRLEMDAMEVGSPEYENQKDRIYDLQKTFFSSLSAWDRVTLARDPKRAKAQDYIKHLFTDFIELHGDRGCKDDGAIIGGLAYFEDMPVTVIAESKGKSFEENMKMNFGMVSPEGYRKALRLAKQAEKFNRPIITIVDTPGAYPGKVAEEHGQAEAIAKCLYTFADLKVPVICIVISEGGSGGALALSVADRIIMLENAVYSILSPEGFASILWKDDSKVKEAAEVMKMTSYDLKEEKIVDYIVKEPIGKIEENFMSVIDQIKRLLHDNLKELSAKKKSVLVEERLNKYRNLGVPPWKM
ncbi:MAG: acetyl-CoA carboxylase carboxyltransferase subunit alpha [Erysipelotrichaceae bacterium]|nr:acetyl-CoA carboxylase carboxyltransferase subunit alpha [Erysipelotrichaceae bacterium]